jgi:hypothetical protein
MSATQAKFSTKKIATTGKMPANQTKGSPVIGTTPCSSGIAQLGEARNT